MRSIDRFLGVEPAAAQLNWKGRVIERVLLARRALFRLGRSITRLATVRPPPRVRAPHVVPPLRVVPPRRVVLPPQVVPAARKSPPPPPTVAANATTQFLAEFLARHSRAPRILHVGNIANNAYLNAKLLNQAGYDCDVICYDYYHLMACPEWEDAEFEGEIHDQLRPDWRSVRLGGFKRPRWFAQGPQLACIDYLIAKRTGRTAMANLLWSELGCANRTRPERSASGAWLRRWIISRQQFFYTHRHPDAPRRLWSKLELWADSRGRLAWLIAAGVAPFLMLGVVGLQLLTGTARPAIAEAPSALPDDFAERFAAVFPDRADQLSAGDWAQYNNIIGKWAELFTHYDIVQAYSTDVVYPMLSGKRPYLGFEHGTLRDFTLGDSPVCRLTSLGYQQADHVLITNGDCLEYAQKINVRSFTAMVHPIDDKRVRSIRGDYEEAHRRFGAKHLMLCPLRHDWVVKGTDKYIRALPAIVEQIGRDCCVIMVRWGAELDRSRELAVSLGVDDVIAWVEPLRRSDLVWLHKSVDVVFDQIALPHFGATAPQAIAAGVPVIMSYDPATTAWIIPEPAPILSAWTPDEIVKAVHTALDPAWRAEYSKAAERWFDRYHSGDRAVRLLSRAYHEVCLKRGLL